ncbi:hypothetical protein BSZ21_17535 [Bradyrhizobium canariense]|nr:hypothetical protein BSZ21_17535 [Bradyrhizobium canariense]
MTAKQFKAARAWLDLSQQDLATETLVGRRAIQEFELGNRDPQPRTLRDLREALEKRGVKFLFIGGRAVGIVVSERIEGPAGRK